MPATASMISSATRRTAQRNGVLVSAGSPTALPMTTQLALIAPCTWPLPGATSRAASWALPGSPAAGAPPAAAAGFASIACELEAAVPRHGAVPPPAPVRAWQCQGDADRAAGPRSAPMCRPRSAAGSAYRRPGLRTRADDFTPSRPTPSQPLSGNGRPASICVVSDQGAAKVPIASPGCCAAPASRNACASNSRWRPRSRTAP